MGSNAWLDVDAPDTNWRDSSEDPIPLAFGRAGWLGFIYRFVTCRPLDGHARTDATLFHAGTKAFTKSRHTAFYNYWPGWRRGVLLTRLPALLLLALGTCLLLSRFSSFSWMFSALPLLGLLALGAWWGRETVSYLRRRSFERSHISYLRSAIVNLLKTRDGIRVEIQREMVGANAPGPTGRVYLPPRHPMPDGDRENLLELIQDRLGSENIDGRFNMEGAAPYLELYVPEQPPSLVSWLEALEHADPENPLLGFSAGGCVRWDLRMESPHIGIVGGAGSGKSELIAWVVAQLMRGGAGAVVLDPKYSSHLWLFGVERVLYCSEAQMIHDTIAWLDEELRQRGRASQKPGYVMPARIVVMIEERNSLHTLLRYLWTEIREPSMARTSPMLAALDRLASQGRSLGIHILLAGQETAERHIGSRANFGAFAVAGRLPAAKWKLTGAARKPAISTRPGRFGYVCGDQVTVFQAVYPDLSNHSARLREYAFGGQVPPLDVQAMMMSTYDAHAFPSSGVISSVSVTGFVEGLALADEARDAARVWFRNQRDRYASRFPEEVERHGRTALFSEADLEAYWMRWHEGVDSGPVDE